MAADFDAKATAVTGQNSNVSPVTNTTLTIGASGTLVIGVFAATQTTTAPVPTAMTWNSVAMTLVGSIAVASGTPANVYVYALVSPATGAHTLSCTFTAGSGASPTVYLDCFSFKGTDVTSVANCVPSANVLTDATTPTGTVYPTTAFSVTSASGDAACAAMNCILSTFPTANVGTLLNHDEVDNGNYTSLYNLSVGATTSAQFGGGTSGNPCCGIAFRIVQATAATVSDGSGQIPRRSSGWRGGGWGSYARSRIEEVRRPPLWRPSIVPVRIVHA